MLRRVAAITLAALCLCTCTPSGKFRNPFVNTPFVPTAVPVDFVIILDEQHNTYFTRQHIQQVITAADGLSRTTYTTLQEFNNKPAPPYSQTTQLTPNQIQAMWNAVSENELMEGSRLWMNWLSAADTYKENTYTLQIKADKKTNSFRQVNGFPVSVQPLVVLVDAVRLPMSQQSKTPIVEAPVVPAASQPASEPATEPATAPATTPATAPSTSP